MPSFRRAIEHIYIETSLLDHPDAKRILSRFPNVHVIPVKRYTDVFNRPHQDWSLQHSSLSLFLARKHGTLIYPGAPVCHDFGNERFFYTSTVINCIYDCEYCWLKGMYQSAWPVIFLNTDAFLKETEALLKDGPMYLSLSFESDLVPLESLTNHIRLWNDFVLQHGGLTAEIRTKSGVTSLYSSLTPDPRMIFSFTLSPQRLIDSSEHFTASLRERLGAAECAMEHGFPVRLSFDPIIRYEGWKKDWKELVEITAETLPLAKVKDISIGTYRQSDAYQKRMRKRFPASVIIQYPYETNDGYCQYPRELREEAEQFVKNELLNHVREEQIYLLEEINS
ncbi:MAG: hypothetical protein J6S26_05200 [Solobacterium sp.]|nr:hypothetical protein [Solobacterium sp.]